MNGSLECKQDIKKLFGALKYIESEFYANDSLNDSLESEI
jgi:hypothetical protein